jgi:hypothetical protein
MLAGSLTANAQGLGGVGIGLTNGATLNSGQSGPGGQHQRPSPEQMAKQLIEKFDANKVGELSQDELTQALEFLRKQPHPQEAGGGQSGGGSASQGGQAGSRHRPAGNGSQAGGQQGGIQLGGQQGSVQIGTGQGGPGGQHQGLPPADKVAAQMIEKFSANKKGLTQAELVKALEWRLANRGQHRGGGQQGGGQPGGSGAGSTNQTTSASGN